jgi:hypothetical protein
MSFLAYSKLHALFTTVTSDKDLCDVTTVTQQCKQPQTTAEKGWKSCLQLTTLNLNHFKMVEAMGLKIIELRSN